MRKIICSFVLFAASISFLSVESDAAKTPDLPSVIRVRVLQSHHPSSMDIFSDRGRIFFPDKICEIEQPLKTEVLNGKISSEYKGLKQSVSSVRIEGQRINVTLGKKIFRTYEGAIDIYADRDELVIVNETPLEVYVHSAALSETAELFKKDSTGAAGWESVLLSSMEICIRSYISANMKRHGDQRYSFCDLTHCVHYTGVLEERKSLTPDLVLYDSKSTVNAFFHSTCGGILSRPDVYWHGEKGNAFKSGADIVDGEVLCRASPHFTWSFFIHKEKLSAVTNCEVENISVIKKEGRVTAVKLKTAESDKLVPIASFMSLVGREAGWNSIKSNNFEVIKTGEGFLFAGNGLGHGIGLCQYGAMALAKKGWKWNQILKYYYPGAAVVAGRIQ